ncbi:MAG TPA: FAD-dependent oxidoreductase [Nonomuraea sp.]|nr:FAD-dependent oxidoreductase [Nonomuraea sp.]
MTPPETVLIVGASAAGLGTAEALRRHGYRGRLTLLDTELHLPYDGPPLSKHVLAGTWEPARAHLRTREQPEAVRRPGSRRRRRVRRRRRGVVRA